jgi:hypothetical protein
MDGAGAKREGVNQGGYTQRLPPAQRRAMWKHRVHVECFPHLLPGSALEEGKHASDCSFPERRGSKRMFRQP